MKIFIILFLATFQFLTLAEDVCSTEFYDKMMKNHTFAVKYQTSGENLKESFIQKIKTVPTPDDLCQTGKDAVKHFQHAQSAHAIVWRGFNETSDNCYGNQAREASERSVQAKMMIDLIRDIEIVELKNYLSRICN